MICDDHTDEEVYQAFLIYSSLHGFRTDVDSVRERIADYLERSIPDEMIDDAILAFSEDRIVAPPDVVLERWGSSRFYELDKSTNDFRHLTCESWFENGCQFATQDNAPRLAHFWTEFELSGEAIEFGTKLVEGVRLQFSLAPNKVVQATHRDYGYLGDLPRNLAREIHSDRLSSRTYLPLVDKDASDSDDSDNDITGQGRATSRILVTTALPSVPTPEVVAYAADAFHAARTKC